MKKNLRNGLFAFTILASLVSCGNPVSSTSSIGDGTSSNQTISSASVVQEDFTIKTSDNGLSAVKSDYLFSIVEDGDQYPPQAAIRLTTDVTWNHCTSINENETKIIAEDENVLPAGSVTLEKVLNSDIVGSSGSNDIDGFDIILNRELIKAGESKLKIQVKPNNGNSSMNKLTTICLNITVKEFGDIEVDTYNVSLNVDLSKLSEIISKESENVTEITLSMTDDANKADVYGYSADYSKQVDIPLSDTYTEAKLENFKFAVGHIYNVQIFVEGEDVSDRIWISVIADVSNDYELTENEDKGNSSLKVLKDNVVINASLGKYMAL